MIQLALEYAFRIAGAEQVTIGVFENNKSAYYCIKRRDFMMSVRNNKRYANCSVKSGKSLN